MTTEVKNKIIELIMDNTGCSREQAAIIVRNILRIMKGESKWNG